MSLTAPGRAGIPEPPGWVDPSTQPPGSHTRETQGSPS